MLLRLLRGRFGSNVSAEIEQRIAAAAGERLEIWTDRLARPDATLADVMAD